MPTQKEMTRERVTRVINNAGKYQLALCLLLSVHSAIVAFNHTEPTFLNYTPSFSCKDAEDINGCVASNETCESGYEFHEEEKTVATEFSLVCHRSYLKSLTTTLYFCGVTAGALLFGPLADRYGRRTIMLICLYSQCILAMAHYFVNSLTSFVIIRTLQGAFVQGLQSSTFTLLLEIFPSRYRTAAGVLWEIYWALGCALMAGLAWLIMDWRWLQLALAVPSILTLFYVWIIPESPAWLTTVGRYMAANRVCDKMIRYNRKEYNIDSCQEDANSHTLEDLTAENKEHRKTLKPEEQHVNLMKMFYNTVLRKHLIIMTIVWFSVTLSYYGTLFYLPNMAGQRHINFLIGAFIEVVSYILAYWILSRFGRRKPLVIYQTICGVICVFVAIMTHFVSLEHAWIDPSLTFLILLSKGCAVSCFCCMFLYTTELFPTCVRGAALGVCGFWSRVGSLLSPQLVALGEYTDPAAHLISLGIVCMIAGAASYNLPETLGKSLPSTIAEAEIMFKKNESKGCAT